MYLFLFVGRVAVYLLLFAIHVLIKFVILCLYLFRAQCLSLLVWAVFRLSFLTMSIRVDLFCSLFMFVLFVLCCGYLFYSCSSLLLFVIVLLLFDMICCFTLFVYVPFLCVVVCCVAYALFVLHLFICSELLF